MSYSTSKIQQFEQQMGMSSPGAINKSPRALTTSVSPIQSFKTTTKALPTRPGQANTMSPVTSPVSTPRPVVATPPSEQPATVRSNIEDKEVKRSFVMKEIIETESAYVQDLETIVNDYLIPLRRWNILPGGELSRIFGNIELLLSVNQRLLTKLNERLSLVNYANANSNAKKDDDSMGFAVGDIFLEIADNFRSYDQYCNNHLEAQELLVRHLRNPNVYQTIETLKQKSNIRTKTFHNLQDYLIKPIQRICKYPLLFKELLKCTPPYHDDYAALEATLAKLEEVAHSVNQSKARSESQRKVLDIQSRLEGYDGKLTSLDRELVLEGPLLKVNPKKKIQERQFFLFTDMLLWAAPKFPLGAKKALVFKGKIQLDCSIARDAADTKTQKFAFQIIRMDNKKIYTLLATSLLDKQNWLEALDKIISGYLVKQKGGKSHLDNVLEAETRGRSGSIPMIPPPLIHSSSQPQLGQRRDTVDFGAILPPLSSEVMVAPLSPLGKSSSRDLATVTPSSSVESVSSLLHDEIKMLREILTGTQQDLRITRQRLDTTIDQLQTANQTIKSLVAKTDAMSEALEKTKLLEDRLTALETGKPSPAAVRIVRNTSSSLQDRMAKFVK